MVAELDLYRLKEEWKALAVETVRGWCNKVKDKRWLASKLGRGRKKKKGKKKGKKKVAPEPPPYFKVTLPENYLFGDVIGKSLFAKNVK